ncbi:hypothetical protein [Flagellimonas myxillae]|uniref:hypothetical protein n=1 Tax=Flagellimonas myxillae TaxID=2942214 RepID=UPI00201ED9B9|nr:hypothetical protein [Muricauda myxillae]MCL6264949.1 hypothetical protein [Muricauda myxillae]
MRSIIFIMFFFTSGLMLLAQQRANVQPGVISVYQKGLQGIGPDFGNNPASENFYSQMRDKFAAMGIDQKLQLKDIEGSIYVNDKFEPGIIFFKGEEERKLFMRYNAFNDEFEIKNSDLKGERALALFKNKDISCLLGSATFSYMSHMDKKGESAESYLKELLVTGDYRLLEQQKKKFKEGKKAKTSHAVSFPHRFVDEVHYYIQVGEKVPMYAPSKKKELIALLHVGHQESVKKFIKEKGIDIKTQKGLTNVLIFAGNL